MVFQFHKINSETRKYIEIKIKEYKENKIKSKYFDCLKKELEDSKYKGIDEKEIESLYLETLTKLYNKEIEYKQVNINYRRNKDLINKIIEIVNNINGNKIDEIINNHTLIFSDDRIERVKCLIYSTIIIINQKIEKRNNNEGRIIKFKENKLERKLKYLEKISNDLILLKKKMKTQNEERARRKIKDKIDKLKIIIEVDKQKREFYKQQNKYFYNNKFLYKFGKRKINYQKLNDEELPNKNESIIY